MNVYAEDPESNRGQRIYDWMKCFASRLEKEIEWNWESDT